MKSLIRTIIIASALAMISHAASAQVYAGGSIGGAYSASESTSSKAWAVSVNPEAGYIFNENWAVGGRLNYGKSVSKTDSKYLKETKTDINLFTINPYAVYAPIHFKNFSICAEMGLELAPKQAGVEFTTFGAYITPLLTYSINEHLVLKTELSFAQLAVSGTSNGTFGFAAAVGGDDAINFGEDLSIGFIYVF